jgi:hypothetical protein
VVLEGEPLSPADGAVRAAIENVADVVRSLADRPWRRARLVARCAGVRYDKDVAFELGDGTEFRPQLGLELTRSIEQLQQHCRDHGSWMFELRCTLTPEAVETVDVDTASDPWPDGWDDPDDVTRIDLSRPPASRRFTSARSRRPWTPSPPRAPCCSERGPLSRWSTPWRTADRGCTRTMSP